jgi:murein L,D-transpeptidase YcbB/YkuD
LSAAGRQSGRTLRLAAAAFLSLALALPAVASTLRPPSDGIAAKLQSRILAAQTAGRLVCRGEVVCGVAELPRFFALRQYRPAWITAENGYALADELVQCLEDARHDGLSPSHYHLGSIRTLLETARQQAAAGRPLDTDLHADLEFLLADAFLTLGSHLWAGQVNPETLDGEWTIQIDPTADLGRVLERAIESGDIGAALDGLRPPHREYKALKAALKRYRSAGAADDWPRLPEKASWERGQAGAVAELLRERLRLSGDLPLAPDGVGADADHELFEGLRRFQALHGLEIDGRMGPQTLQALNVPLRERARQIELNLERWRWLPHALGTRHIRVNVPQFDLTVIEEDQEALRMRVVVGRHYRRTPVFSSLMDHVVFNPDWNIPTRIAVEDILPKARKDAAYLRREKIRVFESWDRGAAELDPDRIDWTDVTGSGFPYKLKKDPGSHNDLGRVKFIFPNKFSVYLHDTRSKQLFNRSVRGFSSGCIRIEKPLELAEYALKDSPAWPRDAVIAAMESGVQRTVRLPRKIPVHLIYMTAGVDSEGRVQFWPDIYRRDPALDRALQIAPPQASALFGKRMDKGDGALPGPDAADVHMDEI